MGDGKIKTETLKDVKYDPNKYCKWKVKQSPQPITFDRMCYTTFAALLGKWLWLWHCHLMV